jgi:hypothetical protein
VVMGNYNDVWNFSCLAQQPPFFLIIESHCVFGRLTNPNRQRSGA